MKDFNFFEPFVEPKKVSGGDDKKILITVAAVVAALAVIAVPAYQQINMLLMKRSIAQYESLLSEESSKRKVAEIEQKETLLSSLKTQSGKVEKINGELNKQDQIGGHIVSAISESLAEDVFINRMSIEKSAISLDGVAKEKEGVASFQNNLRRVPYFEDIFVPNISAENDYNNFTLDMILKGEGESDEKADKEGEN